MVLRTCDTKSFICDAFEICCYNTKPKSLLATSVPSAVPVFGKWDVMSQVKCGLVASEEEKTSVSFSSSCSVPESTMNGQEVNVLLNSTIPCCSSTSHRRQERAQYTEPFCDFFFFFYPSSSCSSKEQLQALAASTGRGGLLGRVPCPTAGSRLWRRSWRACPLPAPVHTLAHTQARTQSCSPVGKHGGDRDLGST